VITQETCGLGCESGMQCLDGQCIIPVDFFSSADQCLPPDIACDICSSCVDGMTITGSHALVCMRNKC
jgi:hypothetical protein